MKLDPARHHRRSIRLKGYDYSKPGAYFVTVRTKDRESLLGEVADGQMVRNEIGEIVQEEWFGTSEMRANVNLDEMILMPNHLHGILVILEERNGVRPVGANRDSPQPDIHFPQRTTPFRSPSGTIGAIIRGFKGASTKRVNVFRMTPGVPVWQGS